MNALQIPKFIATAGENKTLIPTIQNLENFNTFGLRSLASSYVRIDSPDLLDELSNLASKYGQVWILGGGSNVVLPVHIEGLVVHQVMRGIKWKAEGNGRIVIDAMAGENWHDLVTWSVEQGWGGLENLALIPGTVGGAPVQNIGAYGVEIGGCILSITAWDIEERRFVVLSREECSFSYRKSRFQSTDASRWLIISVALELRLEGCGWQAKLSYADFKNDCEMPSIEHGLVRPRDVFDAVCRIRRRKLPDPYLIGNVGSFFKNPVILSEQFRKLKMQYTDIKAYDEAGEHVKLAAAWLIDQCGWKGYKGNRVGVDHIHCLVLVNRGGASVDDIMSLAHNIQKCVHLRFSVWLEMEPIFIL
jgi:UDP-N-acetylmuramate dehydrogenase